MRIISRAESWEKVYEAFEQVNFSAFDFLTIKESIVDYLKLYFSEDFNDWIESSELLPVIEAFAYVGEILAYRFDLNAHENILEVAQRKESVLRLAKLLSYSASRNIPARGLVKVTSISTSQTVFDSAGRNLANTTIRWNDPNNPSWKEQFTLVLNRVLKQDFGTVLPSDRVQVQDVLFELYELDNKPLPTNTLAYNISVSNITYPMELVASQLNAFGPKERRPEKDLQLSILYLSDGLGDSSDNTGFFFFTKQGILNRTTTDFDGVTPNQTYDVNVDDTNEIDIWVNNIDPDTGEIITDDSDTQVTERIGEWSAVDLASAQNIIFNTDSDRNKYEVETLDLDQFRLIFGDGNFSNIPSGRFEIWYRTSANIDISIPSSSIQNVANSFTYYDYDSKEQTFAFTTSLVNPIQNAAPTEDIDHIRRTAPAVYYTQDRMVNGKDYNEFMLRDNSILKLRTINRTFAGDSKYINWHDPREYYENVKLFGADLVVYFNTVNDSFNVAASDLPVMGDLPDDDGILNGTTVEALIDNYIQPLLSTDIFFTTFTILSDTHPQSIQRSFTDEEYAMMKGVLSDASINIPSTVYFKYESDTWQVADEASAWWISAEVKTDNGWTIEYNGVNTLVHSDETKFWISNDENRIITTDTYNTKLDEIVILSANVGSSATVLDANYGLNVVRQVVITEGEEAGTQSIHDLEVVSQDTNGDGFPDDVKLSYLINDDDLVYFSRVDEQSPWVFQPWSTEVQDAFNTDQAEGNGRWKAENGREDINFLWMHRTPRYHLIDPAPSNIMDSFIISRGYYTSLRQWLSGVLDEEPEAPTPFTLRSDYNYMLDNKMISDTVILNPGKVKPIIGPLADGALQAVIKVVRSSNRSVSANQLKTKIVDLVYEFFDINKWEFGETFYFTELSAFLHSRLPVELDSVVLVPVNNNHIFGDLYQVIAREDEIIQPNVTVNDIEIIESINPRSIKQTL